MRIWIRMPAPGKLNAIGATSLRAHAHAPQVRLVFAVQSVMSRKFGKPCPLHKGRLRISATVSLSMPWLNTPPGAARVPMVLNSFFSVLSAPIESQPAPKPLTACSAVWVTPLLVPSADSPEVWQGHQKPFFKSLSDHASEELAAAKA